MICTERTDNPGTSVTNAAEMLASLVASELELDPCRLVWVEHYPASPAHGPQADWDLVTFGRVVHDGRHTVFDDPHWRPMCADDWTCLGLTPADFVS